MARGSNRPFRNGFRNQKAFGPIPAGGKEINVDKRPISPITLLIGARNEVKELEEDLKEVEEILSDRESYEPKVYEVLEEYRDTTAAMLNVAKQVRGIALFAASQEKLTKSRASLKDLRTAFGFKDEEKDEKDETPKIETSS